MKYLLVLFLFVNINSCYDEYPTVKVEDDKAGDIAMSVVAGIADNALEVNFLGTSCLDFNQGVYCDTPLHQTTSVREVRAVVDEFLNSDDHYTQVDDHLVSERTATYTSYDGVVYDVRIILSHRRILTFIKEVKS